MQIQFISALQSAGTGALLEATDNATYPANLCPIHCGGAANRSTARTTILHNECGVCKRFL
jgi:hypothetical protein